MNDELLNILVSKVESAYQVTFDTRFYTDNKGQVWIATEMINQYETRSATILYDETKPIEYYVNFLSPHD